MYHDALTKLFEAVEKAALTEPGITCAVKFGAREPRKSTNQGAVIANRVVFAPGDDSGKLASAYTQAKYPGHPRGRAARSVMTMPSLARVFIWAADTQQPRSEVAQYRAVRELHEWVVRVMHESEHGSGFKIIAARAVEDQSADTAVVGSEMVLDLLLSLPIFDVPSDGTDAASGQGATTLERPANVTVPGQPPHPAGDLVGCD